MHTSLHVYFVFRARRDLFFATVALLTCAGSSSDNSISPTVLV